MAMIDAQKLLEWVKQKKNSLDIPDFEKAEDITTEEIHNFHRYGVYELVESKIHELTQESDFDEQGWCWDMSKLTPKEEDRFLMYDEDWTFQVVYRNNDWHTAYENFDFESVVCFKVYDKPLPPIPTKK